MTSSDPGDPSGRSAGWRLARQTRDAARRGEGEGDGVSARQSLRQVTAVAVFRRPADSAACPRLASVQSSTLGTLRSREGPHWRRRASRHKASNNEDSRSTRDDRTRVGERRGRRRRWEPALAAAAPVGHPGVRVEDVPCLSGDGRLVKDRHSGAASNNIKLICPTMANKYYNPAWSQWKQTVACQHRQTMTSPPPTESSPRVDRSSRRKHGTEAARRRSARAGHPVPAPPRRGGPSQWSVWPGPAREREREKEGEVQMPLRGM